MVNTSKVIGFHTDIFGNEIEEFEQVEKYTVCYKGYIFDGDTDGYNRHNFDSFEKAMEIYNNYPDVSIRDNEYGLVFEYGDWN